MYSVFKILSRFWHPLFEFLVCKCILCRWLAMPLFPVVTVDDNIKYSGRYTFLSVAYIAYTSMPWILLFYMLFSLTVFCTPNKLDQNYQFFVT